jgi:hypothetical protein
MNAEPLSIFSTNGLPHQTNRVRNDASVIAAEGLVHGCVRSMRPLAKSRIKRM